MTDDSAVVAPSMLSPTVGVSSARNQPIAPTLAAMRLALSMCRPGNSRGSDLREPVQDNIMNHNHILLVYTIFCTIYININVKFTFSVKLCFFFSKRKNPIIDMVESITKRLNLRTPLMFWGRSIHFAGKDIIH